MIIKIRVYGGDQEKIKKARDLLSAKLGVPFEITGEANGNGVRINIAGYSDKGDRPEQVVIKAGKAWTIIRKVMPGAHVGIIGGAV